MIGRDDLPDEATEVAERIAGLALTKQLSVAVAESLTSGRVACRLGTPQEQRSWLSATVRTRRSPSATSTVIPPRWLTWRPSPPCRCC